MKLSIVFLLITYLAYCKAGNFIDALNITAEDKAKTDQIEEHCKKESGVNPQLIINFDDGNFSDEPALKSFHRCYLLQFGTLKPDGSWDTSFIKAIVPKYMLKPTEACIQIKGADLDDTAHQVFKCYVKAALDKPQ